MTKAHQFSLRVYYEDTDAGNVVYYANYLKFAERARTEMLRDLGYNHAKLKEQEGTLFVVRSCNVEYKAPARLDDELTMQTEVVSVGNTSMEMQQNVLKGGNVIAEMQVQLVCVNATGRPVRIPEEVRALF